MANRRIIYFGTISSSYTTFKYSDLKITPTTVKAGQNVTVSVTVTNTGSRVSDEVYIHACCVLIMSCMIKLPYHTWCHFIIVGGSSLYFMD